MRIGVDLTSIWRLRTGGSGYAIELAKAILNNCGEDQFVFYFGPDIHPEFLGLQTAFTARVLGSRSELFSKWVLLPRSYIKDALDVLYFPVFPPAPWQAGCLVCCFQDATPWLYPETMTLKGRLYYRWMMHFASKRCKKIITYTEAVKQEMSELLHIPDSRIISIPLGARSFMMKKSESVLPEYTKQKYGLPERFILSVSTIEPRKNLERGLLAFSHILSQKGLGTIKWVIAGREGWGYKTFREKMHELGLGESVILLGHVSDSDLSNLYKLADLLFFPSLYEGFGLPPIEAMANGCPVVASNQHAISEVTGDAAIMVDPLNPKDMAEKMITLMTDHSLRSTIIDSGLERSRLFTWQNTANQTLAVLRNIVRPQLGN